MKFGAIINNIKERLAQPQSTVLNLHYGNAYNLQIDLSKKDNTGITSNTFYQLLSPEFTPATNLDPSGLKITTIIDNKTQKPVQAFVAGITPEYKGTEEYLIMIPDPAGEMTFQNTKYKILGRTYFCIDKEKQMVAPKFEYFFKKGIQYEKARGSIQSIPNKEYRGIGTRLHQIRIERMLQNNLGNSYIVANGKSFPFHYLLGYRLKPSTRPLQDALEITQDFSNWNGKTPQENAKYLFAEKQNGNYVINFSVTLEHFLYEYYKNGGEPLKDILPNMFLNHISVQQWIMMIKKQPILY